MKPPLLLSRRARVGVLLGLFLAAGLILLRAYLQSPSRGLPYRDSFVKGTADEWTALGGTWELSDGMMRNDSDERGAKLLTGSPYWRNYSIEADISLLGPSGDAGLIIRSSNEEEGVNSYSGYYAGLHTNNSSLTLGRAEHGWMSARSFAPSTIRPFRWYHLKLLAYDCQIVAVMTTPSYKEPLSLGIDDPNCILSGRVGLRSYSSGGMWRNVVVRPATYQDLVDMLKSIGGLRESATSVADANHLDFQGPQHLLQDNQANQRSSASTQSIASLRLASFAKPAIATIRGVVILTTPRLYVQDSTGGVYLPQPEAPLLKVGDEVEVTGNVQPGDFSPTMPHATVKVLWARTPMPPVSITATQASTGKYDATFIEVLGHLVGKKKGPNNTLILDLDEGSQSFQAIVNTGRSDYLFSKLKLKSSLRLRGICVVDSAFTNNLTPFVLLLPSNEDLEVLTGPPWWSAEHVIGIVVAILMSVLVAMFLYHRFEHSRLLAVMEERERLAHEMHDTLAQSFAGIGFQLQAIRNGLPNEMRTLHEQLEFASNLVRHSHEEARRSVAALQTQELGSEDILAALDHCARRMVEGGSIQVVLERVGAPRPIPVRVADTLFRIGQEAIANSVRHAQPTTLTIRLKYSENQACLQIGDNGSGFVQGKSLLGFGIRGMRRRAQSISAAFQIQSKPGEGTRIEIMAPLPPLVTLTKWPKFLCKYLIENWINAQPTRHSNSHFYRG